MIKFFQSFALSMLFLVLTGCISEPANNAPLREDREPEAATGLNKTIAKRASHYMVASANPYASEAGYQMLEKGGNAVDAAIAVQLALTLVEPQSSGIGGGAFMLYYDNKQQKITSFNGRETAPANATQDLFLDDNGKPVRWIDAVVGGRSVGVPGVLKALENAHKKHGELPWATLFEYPISLAEDGFIVSDRMAKLVSMAFNPGVLKLENAHNYFYPDGEPIKSGTLLKNPELAKVYKAIASQGTDVFYQGWIAEDIVGAVQNSAIAPGKLSLTDLANYDVEEVEPVCGSYRVYQVCGVPPPSSGGVAVIQILKQLEQHNIGQYAPNSEQSIHLFTQSSRLAFADRARYIGDPKYIDVPVKALLNDKYLEERGNLISLSADMGKAKAGNLALFAKRADDNAIEMPSTSHISIVDGQGNAISMTTSVEMAFGSAVFVDGFLLNKQLTDFSLAPSGKGKLVANS